MACLSLWGESMVAQMRARAAAVSSVLLALSFGMSAPVSTQATTDGYVRVHAHVGGYTAGFGGTSFTFWLECDGIPGQIGLGVATTPLTGDSAPAGPFPTGINCRIIGSDLGDPGELAFFGGPQISPSGPFTLVAGTNWIDVGIERINDESQPPWDTITGFQLDVLTADRALVNKNGGLTIEGRISCDSIDGLPIDPYVGISWGATQYVGRKGAITARYDPAIAHNCIGDPSVPWRTLGPGTQNKVMWIYAPNGKFASGSVHIELNVFSHQELVSQWWDPDRWDFSPDCSTTDPGTGFFDSNGDGFCAYYVEIWGAEQFDLRTERAR